MTAPADQPPSIFAVADDKGQVRGTALLIGVDTVATPAHVVGQLSAATVTLLGAPGNDTYRTEVLVSGRLGDDEPGPDLAILRFTGPRPQVRPATLISRVRPGEQVRAFGITRHFPAGE
jgi:trypsin-like peptidase